MRNYLFILFLPFILSSCFEIIEEIKLKNDGSGTFKYEINFSQSASKIKSLLQMEQVEGYTVPSPEKIKSKFGEICAITESVKGISHVEYSSDFKYFIFKYHCDFNNINALNNAVDSIQSNLKSSSFEQKKFFSYSPKLKTFERKTNNDLLKAYLKMTESQRVIFVGAKYTCLYRFDTNIDTTSNNNVKIAINRKAAFHQLDMLSVMTKPNALKQIIQLK